MKRGGAWFGLSVVVLVLSALVAGARAAGGRLAAASPQGGGAESGWTVPPGAAAEKNPLTVNEAVLSTGKKLFGDKCARCHGLRGKGDGPDGDESHQADMDLTVPAGAARNPDGVLFYKIWNGRLPSKMDPMSKELTKEQVWSLVAYVQTLRGK
jgi:mono/diheme cytochrome c family protein